MKTKITMIAIALLAMFQTIAVANDNSYAEKTVSKVFSCNNDVQLSVRSEHGNVSVNTWSKNKVSIEIKVEINVGKRGNASEVMEFVNFNFNNSKEIVGVETDIDWDKINYKTKNGSKREIKIRYIIMVPESASMNITNKYGNVDINGCNQELTANLKYGNLSVEKLNSKNTNIIVGYGNVTLRGRSERVELIARYGSVDIENIDVLSITSKYASKVALTNVKSASIYSKYDKYTIVNCDDILIKNGKYTNFSVLGLKSSFIAETEMGYGNINIMNILPSFERISIINKYSNVRLSFGKMNDYNLDLSTKYGNIGADDRLLKDAKVLVIDQTKELKKNGTAGQVVIRNKYANIQLSLEK